MAGCEGEMKSLRVLWAMFGDPKSALKKGLGPSGEGVAGKIIDEGQQVMADGVHTHNRPILSPNLIGPKRLIP